MSDEDKTKAAIGDRREQVKGMDRPERLNEGFSIKDAVQGVRETEDLVKLYRREWSPVYVSQQPGAAGRQECEEHFASKYAERVYDEDVRYRPTARLEANEDKYPWMLELKRPNVRGEFKYQHLAVEYAAEQGWSEDVEIVSRNSREDYKLREYSTKKLVARR